VKKLTSALLVVSLCLIGCGAEDLLERGEKSISDVDDSFGKPVEGEVPGQGGELPTSRLSEKTYTDTIFPLVNKASCTGCHEGSQNYVDTYAKAADRVVFGKPNESVFYKRVVLGEDGHPKKWKAGSDEARLLENWINGL
jgi:hypothetical protein